MDKIVDLLPEFLQEWSLVETILYTVIPLVALFLINAAIQNKVSDYESRNGMKLGLSVLTGIWFFFTIFMIFLKVFQMI